MTVFVGSRYENDKVARVLGTDGVRRPTIFRQPLVDLEFAFDEHLIVEGDRLDTLAAQNYGDPELWWAIADVNPEIDVPDPLPPGRVLRIPRAR